MKRILLMLVFLMVSSMPVLAQENNLAEGSTHSSTVNPTEGSGAPVAPIEQETMDSQFTEPDSQLPEIMHNLPQQSESIFSSPTPSQEFGASSTLQPTNSNTGSVFSGNGF